LINKNDRQYRVVIADDDIDDQFLITRAIQETRISHSIYIVHNGIELINLLFTPEGGGREENKPDLIVMDLNMPLLDGFGALTRIRANPLYAGVPIYVLSTSRFEYDRVRSKELGATDFYTKPYQFEALKSIVKEIFTQMVTSTANSKVD
jgi:CheY-like chemotaxis protein